MHYGKDKSQNDNKMIQIMFKAFYFSPHCPKNLTFVASKLIGIRFSAVEPK